MNILLGLTSSVACTLAPKVAKALQELGEVQVIQTSRVKHFLWTALEGVPVYKDEDEWRWKMPYGGTVSIWEKGDRVLHIDLGEWADIFVIAPLTANTLGKMANGLCDNLLTSVWRAWDWKKPVVVAPAMNTRMWENRITQDHLRALKLRHEKFQMVRPVVKRLACGTEGMGAMAPIDEIVRAVRKEM